MTQSNIYIYYIYIAAIKLLLFLSEENICLCLSRKSCNVFVCVYVELFPRNVCKVIKGEGSRCRSRNVFKE